MNNAIHTLGDLLGKVAHLSPNELVAVASWDASAGRLGKVAHLSPNELVAVASWDASAGRLGPMPSTYHVADLVMGPPVDDARVLANLTETTVAAMHGARLLADVGGCRIERLKTLVQGWERSPFEFAAVFMGLSRHDLGQRLGLDRAAARRLWSPWWRSVRGVDQVAALAGLGRELAGFLEEHDKERRRLHGRQAA